MLRLGEFSLNCTEACVVVFPFLLARRRISTITALPRMAGIADFPAAAGRLPRRGGLMDIARRCRTSSSIVNRQSAIGTGGP
jgi:hypothetical protein